MRLHRFLDPLLFALSRFPGRRGAASGVLLISAGGLGDVALFSRVLERFLPLARAGEAVTVLLRSDSAKMGFLFPPEVTVLPVDFSCLRRIGPRFAAFRRLFAGHYRLVIATDYLRHPDLDEALVRAARAADAVALEPRPSAKHGRRQRANRRLFSRLFDSGPPLTDKILRWAGFAEFLTGEHRDPPAVRLSDPPRAALTKPTAVLQPFSAVAAKQSPPALWQTIIDALPPEWEIRLAGHPTDLERHPAFAQLLNPPRVVFEPAPFRDLAPVLAGASLVVSVDTAAMHLAAVMGAPTLCLASAAYVGEIVPYHPSILPDNLLVLYSDRPCQGCLGNCCFPLIDGMYPCVAALNNAAVRIGLEAVLE